ncbi:hypothetical protein D0Z03_002665 [Geotrichum reessii]|nr:hypothetical protein D0Z03_002665 [Galactomyces reessii]
MNKQLDLATNSIKSVLETLSTDTSFINIGDKTKASAASGGLSLLDLKNQALLSYLHNSVLILLGKLERCSNNDDADSTNLEELKQKAVKNTVTQRVVLEKGVRGLESKVSYQVEKALRAYARSKADAEEKSKKVSKNNEDDDDDEDNDEDLLMFKPNPKLLLNNSNKPTAAEKPKSRRHRDSDSEDDEDKPRASTEKYQVPKISAVSQQQAHPDAGPNPRANKRQVKNAIMEDYLEATSVTPVAEPSIGSTILDHGRGGIKSARDRRKEKEIRDYEETNYTRLTSIQKKEQTKKNKKGRHDFSNDSFFGEDWNFSSKSNVDSATKKRRSGGAASVWDKAKKRRR